MVFDRDADLTKDFRKIVVGKDRRKKKEIGFGSVKDFEFSRENAGRLDLGFKTNAISKGADVIRKARRNGRRRR